MLVDVDFSIPPNRIVGLIGPNGSGKSTLFNCITGIYRADRGRVIFAGCDITQSSGDQISLQGLTRSFQMVQIYPQLSVLSNLLIAIQEHQERSVLGRILRTGKIQQAEVVAMERANYVMKEFGLESLRDVPAGVLSYGQRKLVEFAAVLMPDPKLILLDEPAAAINPTMINQMKQHIREYQRLGKTVFLADARRAAPLVPWPLPPTGRRRPTSAAMRAGRGLQGKRSSSPPSRASIGIER